MERLPCMCMAVVLFLVGTAQGVRDPSVCSVKPDDTTHAGQRPRLPDLFSVRVECKIPEKNHTTYVTEYYDLANQRGRLRVTDPQTTEDFYYNYKTGDILYVNPDNSACMVTALAVDPNRFILGNRGNAQYQSRIYSPAGALHFGNANETYNGTTVVRGIAVDSWVSCQYLASIDATALVTWYFSRDTSWDVQIGHKTMPVRMVVAGTFNNNGKVTPFNHIYDFYDFRDNVGPWHFELPAGVYCRGRISTNNNLPQLPKMFSFQGELANPYQATYTVIEENYDNVTRMTEFNFKVDDTHLTGINELSELNDYNSGASYTIDHKTQSCSITSIQQGSLAFTKKVNNRQVRMQTPQEFFDDSNMNYQYAGQMEVRGITCDKWVGFTDKALGYQGTNVTVEWYFATSDFKSWNTAVDSQSNPYRIPVLYQLFIPGDIQSEGMNFNIFYFNTDEPPLYDVDISTCLVGRQSQTFRITLDSSVENAVRTNVPATIEAVKSAISLYTGVSKLRIANVELYFDNKVRIIFDLLDKPTWYNDTVNPTQENTLQAAAQLLKDTFRNNMFQISFAAGTQVVTIPSNATALDDVAALLAAQSTSSSGFSGGALAGLGIGMLIIGGAAGAGGAFAFLK